MYGYMNCTVEQTIISAVIAQYYQIVVRIIVNRGYWVQFGSGETQVYLEELEKFFKDLFKIQF